VFIVQVYQTSQYVVARGGISSRQVAQLFRMKFRRENECPIGLRSEHPIYELSLTSLLENNLS
jgi:hypothetical protein